MFDGVYKDARAMITGHTGFKGSWLSLWLERLGARVSGYALAPQTEPNHSDLLALVSPSHIADLRDIDSLRSHLHDHKPEAVFHLAAQASVLESYADPIETFSSNVLGTANVLEACRDASHVRAVVIVTTDKCYENQEWDWGYRETDLIGGHDPYSASKACAELVTASYRRSYLSVDGERRMLVATARAGNVVGGGDWTKDRLVPDAMAATAGGKTVQIRHPGSSRPWQHVLDPLAGYLLLGQRLIEGDDTIAAAWNFGPDPDPNLSVAELVEEMQRVWPAVRAEVTTRADKPYETNQLVLDSARARKRLGWRPVWTLQPTIKRTVEWYRAYYERGKVISSAQLDAYVEDAMRQGITWAR